MITIEHVLCPIDFSPCSRRAFDYAVGVARWYGARITALYVTDLPDTPMGSGPVGRGATALARPTIPELRDEVRSFVRPELASGIPLAVEVVEGPVAEEIATQARVGAADLVVLGTHGRTGLDRVLLGSVAARTLRLSPCPVLTIPPHAPEVVPIAPGLFKRILCPTNFSATSELGVRWALAFAQEADAELCLLHVFEREEVLEPVLGPRPTLRAVSRDAERWAATRLHGAIPESARTWCTVREMKTTGIPHHEIVRVADRHACDLIVMGVEKGRGLGDRLFGSTSEHVIRAGGCAVLTVHEERANP